MSRPHVCPWWGGYFIDNPLRRLLHNPQRIVAPYLRDGMTVMDFGCGMGFFSIAMARLIGPGGMVIAVDVQPQMLAVLRRRAAKAGVSQQIRTHLCQPNSLGINEPVDFVLAFYAAHEVPDLPRLFRELYQCLRPQCSMLLVEPIIHVTAARFRQMLATAEQLGLLPGSAPRVRLSHSALLTKSICSQG